MATFGNRQIPALLAIVLVCVVAISMSAATLTTAEGAGDVTAGRPGFFLGQNTTNDNIETDNGSGQLLEEGSNEGAGRLRLAGCNQLLAGTPGTLLYFVGLVGVLYLVKRRFSLGFALLGGYALVPIALAVYFLRTDCYQASPGIGRPGMTGNSSILTNAPPAPEVSPIVLLGIFVVLFVGVAAVIFVTAGDREFESEAEEDGDGAEADVGDIAAAAAEAADRLEERNADVDNEVYRAWWNMTQLLNVSDPETHTPGEFAEAAVELGIEERYVDSLTTLFEEVRYGHRDPATREERAIEVFRAIEEEYGDDDAAGDRPDDAPDRSEPHPDESTDDHDTEDEQ